MKSAQSTLSPMHLQLIRALAEDAVARGYLTPKPAPVLDSSAKCADRVALPNVVPMPTLR